jgi:GDP-mannose 6-dehydrogenase
VRLSIFGLGFVGTVTAGCLASRDHEVIGVDVDRSKVDMLARGHSPVLEPEIENLLAAGMRAGRIRATLDWEAAVAESEMSLVCVGVGTEADGTQNVAALELVVRRIGEAIAKKGRFHSVVVRVTVLPTTMRRRILPLLEQTTGKTVGVGFGLAHHPEFMREGSAVADFRQTPRTVIGVFDQRTADLIAELYGEFSRSVFRTTPEVSEAIKYADNAWHALKVAFANEIGTICNAGQIDSHAVMELFCADDRLNISRAYLKPGFGFGGSCLTKDLRAIVHWGEATGLELPLLSAVERSNQRHLQRSVDWLVASGRRRFALLGLAYKAGTDDLRASPFLHLARELRALGREVRAYDPDVSQGRQNPSHHDYVRSVDPGLDTLLTDDLRSLAAWSDAIVICSYAPRYREIFTLIGPDHIVLDFARTAAADVGPHRYHAFV